MRHGRAWRANAVARAAQPVPHLNDAEVEALHSYLKTLVNEKAS